MRPVRGSSASQVNFPSPLWGGARVGVAPPGMKLRQLCTAARPPPDPNPSPQGGGEYRPITFHLVTAGWPSGSCFIHQPRVSSRRPSGSSMTPSSASRRALDDGPIGLGDGAVLEQLAEARQRLAVAAEHEAAGGVAVEPVRQCRRARQAEAQRVEIDPPGFRRPWGRDARRTPPACRSPASARRGREAATPSRRGHGRVMVMVAYLGETAITGGA